MALPSLQPRRLGRYRDLALILLKYGRSDLLSRAGMEEILAEELPPSDPGAAAPDELAHDLERLGPTFVKLGQILSTRADLLPDSYLTALARLQDEVGRLVREFRATLLREVDYRIEAENLRALSRNLSGFERVFVPQPVAEYSTSRVLTMDYVAGTKVTALNTAAREAVDSADLADV